MQTLMRWRVGADKWERDVRRGYDFWYADSVGYTTSCRAVLRCV